MSNSTQATLALSKAGIAFLMHHYEYDSESERIGVHAAEAIGEPASRVLKTLMVEVGGKPACVIIPADKELSMKRVAAAFGGKEAHMMRPEVAERITGYHVGGISPFGQRKRVPMAIEKTAMEEPYVIINGGQRGLLLRLVPQAAATFLDAALVPLVS